MFVAHARSFGGAYLVFLALEDFLVAVEGVLGAEDFLAAFLTSVLAILTVLAIFARRWAVACVRASARCHHNLKFALLKRTADLHLGRTIARHPPQPCAASPCTPSRSPSRTRSPPPHVSVTSGAFSVESCISPCPPPRRRTEPTMGL